MLLIVLLLLAGFVALYFGAEWLVRGASEIALHLHLSKSFVGLTLVAMGTSAPEFFVNMISAYHGKTAFALSNVSGSNLTNLCLGFGLCALFCTLPIKRGHFLVDMVIAAATPLFVLAVFLLVDRDSPSLPIWSIAPFTITLVVYIYYLTGRRSAEGDRLELDLSMPKSILIFLAGMVALFVGGHLVFTNAVELAELLSVPETVIGLTIVACGTSIPDVTASVIAARKREFEIAAGNLLGSNISNVIVVLNGTLMVAGRSLTANQAIIGDYAFVCLTTVMFVILAASSQRVYRWFGILLLAVFIGYYSVRIGLVVQEKTTSRVESRIGWPNSSSPTT